MAPIARSQRFWSSLRKNETRMGKTMVPAPMTPKPAMLVKEAMVPRFSVSRVETATSVELAVL